jgi:hypothetical protein
LKIEGVDRVKGVAPANRFRCRDRSPPEIQTLNLPVHLDGKWEFAADKSG